MSRFAGVGQVLALQLAGVRRCCRAGSAGPRGAPRQAYLTAFADAGLSVQQQRAMTPFLRLFLLKRSARAR